MSSNGNPKKLITKLLNIVYLIADNGSGFDSYIVLINLPQWRTVTNLNKNGSGAFSRKIFSGYEDKNKKIPQ